MDKSSGGISSDDSENTGGDTTMTTEEEHAGTNNNEDQGGEEEVKSPSPELVRKYPLYNSWAMWVFRNDRSRDWASNLYKITSFSTVEDFWALYNYLARPSELPVGCDYSMFKDGIVPKWEDENNRRGGRWLINLSKQQRHTDLDKFWIESLLCLIGEAFDDLSDHICGCVVNVRGKGDKLGLWTRDASSPDANLRIGQMLKQRLYVPQDCRIHYQNHSDTMSKSGSTPRSIYTV